MVNLEWYRTFKAIYQNGNLTRAAEELLISQPNVSIQLAALESYVGQKLFLRLPRKLVPTEYGKLLYTQIVGAVENLEQVEVDFRKSALKHLENIRIGAPIEYTNKILLEQLRDVDASVHLLFGLAEDLVDKLVDGELDFVIATQRIIKDNLVYEPLVEENFLIVGHTSIDTRELEQYVSVNDKEEIEKWLINRPWISYDSKLSIIRRFWKENFNKRPLIKPRMVIPDFNIIIKAVTLNYGISVVSDLFVKDYLLNQKLKILWQNEAVACNQLWLAYNPLRIDANRVNKVMSILKGKN